MRTPYALAALLALAAHVAIAAPTSSTNTLPTAIPSGAAGGDLGGTYPSPSVVSVGGKSFTVGGTGSLTFTLSGATNVTLPTSGTVATLSNNLGQFSSTTSAQLAATVSDETGSGALVFGTSPTFVTPTLGASTGTSLSLTGLGSVPVATATGIKAWVAASGTAPFLSFLDSARTTNNRNFSMFWLGGTVHFTFYDDASLTNADAFSCTGGEALGSTGCSFVAPVQINGNLALTSSLPTITSGFGTTPIAAATTNSIGANSFAFTIGSGGTASMGVLGMPTAAHGWNCHFTDETTQSAAVTLTKQTADTVSSVTVSQFTDVSAAGPWAAGDVILGMCFPR